MKFISRLQSILRWITRRDRAEKDLNDELQAFVDLATEDDVRAGATAVEARRRAMLRLGGLAQVKEQVRRGRHGAWLDLAGQDVRCGLRQLRRNPAFSAIAIATIVLGIGGITAMFSVFDAVLIRPLPYTEADRLVMIWDAMGESDITSRHNSTPAEWIEWRRLNTVFTDLAGTQPAEATLSGGGEPEQVPARKVTWTFWSVLGVQPLLGRVFTEDEDNPGVRVVVISHGLWLVETALAVVLLTCCGLLLQSFQHLRNTEIGFRRERLLTFETQLFRYKDFDRRVAFINEELAAVRAIPGVVNAGAINRIPFTNLADATFYWLEGQPRNEFPHQVALMRNVSSDYFPTVGARLHEGRFFHASDQASKLPLAIVNEPFATRPW